MNTVIVQPKSAAPSGVSTLPDRPMVYRRALRVRLPNFMLEDVVDAAMAKAALTRPENKDRIAWKTVKEQLGL